MKGHMNKSTRINEYSDMINAVDSKLAEISKIISEYDCELSNLVDERLTDFVNHLEEQNSKL